MGWKTFKEHFNIEHIVRIEEGKLYIGSPYLPKIVPIDINTGKILRGDDFDHPIEFLKKYYPAIAEASPELIKSLLDQKDVFERGIEVFTFDYQTYDIISKYCEAVGYPNVTHDGCLMYNNEYFEERNQAVERARKSLADSIEQRSRRVEQLKTELLEANTGLEDLKGRQIIFRALWGY